VTTWRAKESYGTSQTCASHGKLAAMGQRIKTLRKENKKEVLAYFIINGYFVLIIIYLLFLLYLNMTSTICMAYFIAYLVL
jgi:Na+/melibiose symporter-like transporter